MRMRGFVYGAFIFTSIFLWFNLAWAGCGTFYKDTNYGGKEPLSVCDKEYANLDEKWDDKISSYRIDSDTDCVVTKNSKFGGSYLDLNAGTSENKMPDGWNDKITSIKCASKGYFSTNTAESNQVIVYEHNHFAGKSKSFNQDGVCHDLGDLNDKVSSYRVGSNIKVIFYKDKNCPTKGSQSEIKGPSNQRDLSDDWNDKYSSLKIVPMN